MPSTTDHVQVLYTARTHTTGGRDSRGQSDDGRLDVQLGSPATSRPGTNPEQLFAVGWSACFIGALGLTALGPAPITRPMRVTPPADMARGSPSCMRATAATMASPAFTPPPRCRTRRAPGR